ncbi:MAG: RNA polymerase sigma factor, partial [Acidimicrobiales bacterium]
MATAASSDPIPGQDAPGDGRRRRHARWGGARRLLPGRRQPVAFDVEGLWEQARPIAMRLALALVRDPYVAEDVVSDGFERVLRAARDGRLDGHPNPLGYTLMAVRSATIDWQRRQGHVASRPAPEPVATGDEPAEATTDSFQLAAIAEGFDQLPERWQTALVLVDVEGWSYAEAADVLEIERNAVAQLLHRARSGLRLAYLDVAHGGPPALECRSVQRDLARGRRLTPAERLHVDGCDDCRERRDELAGLLVKLPNALFPLVGGTALAAAAATGGTAGALAKT